MTLTTLPNIYRYDTPAGTFTVREEPDQATICRECGSTHRRYTVFTFLKLYPASTMSLNELRELSKGLVKYLDLQ